MKRRSIVLTVLLIGLLYTVLAGLATLFITNSTRDSLRAELFDLSGKRQAIIAEGISQSLIADVKTLADKLSYIAQINEIQAGTQQQCQSKLEEINKHVEPPIGNLGRINKEGFFHCSVNKALVGIKANTLGEYVNKIFNDPEHRMVMSQPIKPPGANTYVVAVHVPVYDSNDEFNGTLGGAIYLNEVQQKYLKDITVEKDGYAVLIDEDLTILSHPEGHFVGAKFSDNAFQEYIGHELPYANGVNDALRGGSGVIHHASAGVPKLAAYKGFNIIDGRKWILFIHIPIVSIEQSAGIAKTSNLLNKLNLIEVSLIFIGAGVVVAFMLFAVIRPIRKIYVATENFAAGDLNFRVNLNRKDEIGVLAKSFNAMAGRLKDYYGSLEEAVKAKTHELDAMLRNKEERNKELENTKKAILNILEDLNEEKSKLQSSEERFELAAKATNDAIYDLDIKSSKLLWSDAIETQFGWEKGRYKETIDWWLEQIHPDDKESVNTNYNNALKRREEFWKSEYRFLKANGDYAYVQDRGYLVYDNKGEAVRMIGTLMDITERKELEQAKDEFVSLASHQLRTPATAVKNFIGLLKEGYAGELSAEQKEYVDQAYESNEREIGVINDLLHVARTESGQLKMKLEEGNLTQLVKDIIREQQATIDEREQKLIFSAPKQDIQCNYDKEYMRMAIENLLSNASKYTPANGQINIKLESGDGDNIISIADTGVGISKEDFAKLFKKFSRIDNKLSVVRGGTGIGLYLVKQIVDLHKGSVEVKSTIGKGSTFMITIPKNLER